MPTTSVNRDAELLKDGTMTIQQAADFTGYSRDSIEEMLDAGELPYTQARRPNGKRLIPKLALVSLLAKNMVNGGSVVVAGEVAK